MIILTVTFPANHPCGAGHFPGNPIIPGALLLDEVLAAIDMQLGSEDNVWQVQNSAWHIKSAKFSQPVRPGDTVLIDYTHSANGEIRFECTVSNSKVMSGIASLQPMSTESFTS